MTTTPITNHRDDTYGNSGPDELMPGETFEIDGRRYTVDHIDLPGPAADPANVDVHTTSGAVFSLGYDDTVLVVTRDGIPALGAEPDRRPAGTVVHYWSGITLPAAATLVRRADLRPGDVVQSSHGYPLHVTFATVQGKTSDLRGTLHSPRGVERTERYDADALIPVYSRGPETTPAPADTVTLTLTREQVQHLGALVDHAGRWHREWDEYIRPAAVLNEDMTEAAAEATEAEHEAASALGVELLRQVKAAATVPSAAPTV